MTDAERADQHGNVNLGWWVRAHRGDFAYMLHTYAEVYLECARAMLDRFLQQPTYSDAEALPILYTLAHFAELGLKACHEYKRLILKSDEGVYEERHRNEHSLSKLLDDARRLFSNANEFLSNDTQDFFKMLDGFNLQAAFRYPYDKNGKPAWEDTPIIPMAILKRQVDLHCLELQDLYYRLDEIYASEANDA
jgi:hypothetical protein